MGETPTPPQSDQSAKEPKPLLSATHRPHIVGERLADDAAHVAVVQVHVPGERRVGGVGGTRPVVARLDAGEGVVRR